MILVILLHKSPKPQSSTQTTETPQPRQRRIDYICATPSSGLADLLVMIKNVVQKQDVSFVVPTHTALPVVGESRRPTCQQSPFDWKITFERSPEPASSTSCLFLPMYAFDSYMR